MMNRETQAGGPAAVLHGAVAPDARKDELDVLVQVQAVSESLRRLGFEPVAASLDLDLATAAESLRLLRPRLVFNLVESIGGRDRLMVLAPALLEALHLPYTGCSAAAVVLSGGKLAAKRLLRRAGIPTPPWAEVPEGGGAFEGTGASEGGGAAEPGAGLEALSYPALLKSAWDHASFGLEELYGSAQELRAAWQERLEGPAPGKAAPGDAPPGAELFAESYIDGREFNLSLLEEDGRPRVLPPAEMRFLGYPEGKPRIVGYAAKWDQGSFEYTHTVRCFDFEAGDRGLLERLAGLARRCWELFELSGYARVDFRVDAAGLPWVLEVNVNPCLSPDAGFVAAAERAGLSYDAVVERLVRAALDRGGRRKAGASARAVPGGKAGQPKARAGQPGARAGRDRAAEEALSTGWTVRDAVLPGDVAAVRGIVESSGFFSDAEIQLAADLVQERLERGEASGYQFLFAEPPDAPGRPEGYTCFGPIPCTSASYDLYWIAVRGGGRGRGVGTALLRHTEQKICRLGGRRIYVETSSRPQYEPTRGFYGSRGYRVETVLEDFYAPGDGKVVFVKEIE